MTQPERASEEARPRRFMIELESAESLLAERRGGAVEALAELGFLERRFPGATDRASLARRLAAFAEARGCWSEARRALEVFEEVGREDEEAFYLTLRESEKLSTALRLWKVSHGLDAQTLACIAGVAPSGLEACALAERFSRAPASPTLLEHLTRLSRQVRMPGWMPEGSWGVADLPGRGSVWWDGAHPEKRQNFGMDLTSQPISLQGLVRCRLFYSARQEVLGLTDRCYLEIDAGDGWHKLDRLDGVQDWSTREIDLSAYDGKVVRLRFMVLSGSNREGEGVFLDRLSVSGVVVDASLAPQWRGPCWEAGEECWTLVSQGEEPLESEEFDLVRLACPALAFRAELTPRGLHDRCDVEVCTSEGEWQLLDRLTGRGDHCRSLDLAAYQGQKVRLRFAPNLSGRLAIHAPCLKGARPSCERTRLFYLHGDAQDGPEQARELVRLVLEEDRVEPAVEQLCHLAETIRTVGGALRLLPLLRPHFDDPRLERWRLALIRLWLVFGEQAVDLFPAFSARLEEGEDPETAAALLALCGPEAFGDVRELLGEGLEPVDRLETAARFLLEVGQRWGTSVAEAAFLQARAPLGAEPLEERLKAVSAIFELHADAPAEALKSLPVVFGPCGRDDDPLRLVEAYRMLLERWESPGRVRGWFRRAQQALLEGAPSVAAQFEREGPPTDPAEAT